LKVKFTSSAVRREVLIKGNALNKNASNANSAIYYRPDLTKTQSELDKKLREEWMTAGKDRYTIKNGKVVPRLANRSEDPSVSHPRGASIKSSTASAPSKQHVYFSRNATQVPKDSKSENRSVASSSAITTTAGTSASPAYSGTHAAGTTAPLTSVAAQVSWSTVRVLPPASNVKTTSSNQLSLIVITSTTTRPSNTIGAVLTQSGEAVAISTCQSSDSSSTAHTSQSHSSVNTSGLPLPSSSVSDVVSTPSTSLANSSPAVSLGLDNSSKTTTSLTGINQTNNSKTASSKDSQPI
jgi:hypothetical protein